MTYSFIYNSWNVIVDVQNCEITISNPNATNVIRKFMCGNFSRFRRQGQISIQNSLEIIDINDVVNTTKLPPRTYSNNDLNSLGIGYYDFFNSLVVDNDTIGNIADKALLNNQLENMNEFFGKKIACFNPYNDWNYFQPLQLSLELNDQSFEEANDGNAKIIIDNLDINSDYEYSLDGTVWQDSNIFEGLTQNSYIGYAREKSQLVPFQIPFDINTIFIEYDNDEQNPLNIL